MGFQIKQINELRTLIKYSLEWDRGVSYWSSFLIPSIESLGHDSTDFDFSLGSFYTELPGNARLDRLNDFTLSGIIPSTPLFDEEKVLSNDDVYAPRCIFSTREEMKRSIYEYLQSDTCNRVHVYFENKIEEFNSSYTIKEIAFEICMTRPGEPFIAVFSCQHKCDIPIFKQKITRIICTAYNGEAFINWEYN